MSSIEILEREHALILRVVGRLEDVADAVQSNGRVDESFFRKAFAFAKGFVHRVHQAKEEIFARRAAACGVVIAEEDVLSDALGFVVAALRVLSEALQGDPAAVRLLSENAKAYVGLTRAHVAARRGFYAEAERRMSEEDDGMLVTLFKRADCTFREAGVEHYVRLADDIEVLAEMSLGSGAETEAARHPAANE